MLSFLAILMNPFFIQDGMIVNDPYCQQMNVEDEAGENDDTDVLLAYDGSGTPAGQIMTISQDSAEPLDLVESLDQDEDSDEDIDVQIPNEEPEQEIQEISSKQISQAMEKEFGEMRMIQLANAIAGDMGMITKVTLAG